MQFPVVVIAPPIYTVQLSLGTVRYLLSHLPSSTCQDIIRETESSAWTLKLVGRDTRSVNVEKDW